MRKRALQLFTALFPVLGLAACVIMAEHVSGKKELSYLNGQDVLPIEFRYPDPKVTRVKTESEYLHDKILDLNEEKRGKGDLFKKEWHQNKSELYEPAFIQAMNRELEEDPLKIRHRSNTDEKYPIKALVKVNTMQVGKEEVVRSMEVETHMLLKERGSEAVLTELKDRASSPDSVLLEKSFHLQLKEGFKRSGKHYGRYFDDEEVGLTDGS